MPEKGGFKGWLGLAEEVSDISLACRQIGPIRFKEKMTQGDDMFRQRRSLFFKKMQIVRGCEAQRASLHGLFGQADRRLTEKFHILGTDHALGGSRYRCAKMRRIHPVAVRKGFGRGAVTPNKRTGDSEIL